MKTQRKPGIQAGPTAPGTAALLELDGVSVRLGGREILSDVSLTIRPGEFVSVIGPNGAGKTTLLRVILGLIPAAGGRIRLDGSERPRPRAGGTSVGYVPQKLSIDPDVPLRARDVVSLGLDGHKPGFRLPRWLGRTGPGAGGPGRSTRRELADAALADVGASGYADARVGELSGGEQQRVMIAHALIGRPRLLLLDEPLANLDLRSEQEIVSLLGRLAREQDIAIMLSAHDMNPLLGVMDRIVYVAGGQVATGTADEVVTTEGLSALYGHHVDVLYVHDRVVVVAG